MVYLLIHFSITALSTYIIDAINSIWIMESTFNKLEYGIFLKPNVGYEISIIKHSKHLNACCKRLPKIRPFEFATPISHCYCLFVCFCS